MDKNQARQQANAAKEADLQKWVGRSYNRAMEKIKTRTFKGETSCEIDLKFPPRNPDDKTSYEVAEKLVTILEQLKYSVQAVQRTNHTGAICRISWEKKSKKKRR
jgi:hypothetical protein